jgi:DNA polymerase III delta prime subunit
LFFLIPFHLLTYEKNFGVYEENPQRLSELTSVYEEIAEKLNLYEKNQKIDSYTKSMIVDMSKKVLEHLAMKYSKVKKGVSDIMGGKILEYPTKTAWRQAVQQGMQQGMQQGIQQGEINKLIELIKKKMAKNYSVEQIADALEESVETIQDIIEGLTNDRE